MSKSRNRAVSWIILIVFILVILCSSAFIITHTNHECTDKECFVCMELAQCHKSLHTLGTTFAGALQLTLMLCIAVMLVRIISYFHSEHTTLISLKVELLN